MLRREGIDCLKLRPDPVVSLGDVGYNDGLGNFKDVALDRIGECVYYMAHKQVLPPSVVT